MNKYKKTDVQRGQGEGTWSQSDGAQTGGTIVQSGPCKAPLLAGRENY